MRIDSFFFSFIILVLSLLALLFSDKPLLSDIAYISTLLSIALFTVDDWLDVVFMKLARFLFALSKASHVASYKLERTNNVRRLFFMRQTRSLKARQRWSHQRGNSRVRRTLHNRSAY